MRSLLLVIVVLTWLTLGWIYIGSQQLSDAASIITKTGLDQDLDDGTSDASEEIGSTSEARESVLFNYNQEEFKRNDDWEDYKEDLLDDLQDDEILQITGQYAEKEEFSGSLENLGLARAEEVRKALGLAPEKVQLRGILKKEGADKENPFEAISFRNIIVNSSIDESIENRTIIRFPSNSINKLDDQVVEEYLDKLVVRVKKSGEKVKLTGFSDSDGLESDNKILGQRRADVIKQYLISKGVSKEHVITLSKGELNPIASNETEAGKAQNRRTELEIIK